MSSSASYGVIASLFLLGCFAGPPSGQEAGRLCEEPAHCESGVCTNGRCQAPTCHDGVQNGDETGVDCGGSCPACAPPGGDALDGGGDADTAGPDTVPTGDTGEPDEVGPVGDTSAPDEVAPVDDTSEPDDVGPVDCAHYDAPPCVLGVWSSALAACEGRVQDGAPCEDGDPCTDAGTCDPAGACATEPLTCDDGVVCSIGSCDPGGGGCVYDTTACECSTHADCADGKPCTDDVCNPATWTCENPVGVGNPCNDLDPCTEGDACDASGACVGVPKLCDDDNACTIGACNALTGACDFTPVVDGAACDDGDACTAGDRCQDGQCVAGYLSSLDKTYPYDGAFARVFQRARPLTDGGYIVADRRIYDGPANNGIIAMRLTQVGNVAWESVPISSPWPGYWSTETRALEVSAGAVHLLSESWMVRFALDTGDVTWTVSAHVDGVAVRHVTSRSGILYGVGFREGPELPEPTLWLGSFSHEDGAVTWGVEPTGGAGLRGELMRADAGGFLVAGTTGAAHGDDVWVARLNLSGGIQWQTTMPRVEAQRPVALLADSEAVTLVAATTAPFLAPSERPDRVWLARLTPLGALSFETIPTDDPFVPTGAVLTADGRILAVGSDAAQFPPQAQALWFDASGAPAGGKAGPTGDWEFTSVAPLPTGYVMTGSHGNPYLNSSGRLMVTDFDLETPCQP